MERLWVNVQTGEPYSNLSDYERPHLKNHRKRIHTDTPRPFKCGICEAAFIGKGDLTSHMISHSEERRFPCDWEGCGKAFKRVSQNKTTAFLTISFLRLSSIDESIPTANHSNVVHAIKPLLNNIILLRIHEYIQGSIQKRGLMRVHIRAAKKDSHRYDGNDKFLTSRLLNFSFIKDLIQRPDHSIEPTSNRNRI